MAVYPSYSTINYVNPVTEDVIFKTLTSNFDNLGVQRTKRKWQFPKRNITIQYEYMSLTESRTLFDFYIARSGSYEAFVFFYQYSESYTGEYIGTGDGSTVIFNLPCKTSSGRTVYVDNNTQSEGATGADYAFTALGGTDGEDKIEFSVAPSNGSRIKIDFTGILKIRCRFAEDNMSLQTFYTRLKSGGVKLRGLLNT